MLGGLVAAVVIGSLPAALSARQSGGEREDLTVYLPPGDGKAKVTETCTTCHDLRGIIQLRKSKDDWEALVLDMGARGAPLMLDEIDPIVAYLTSVFGPKSPPFTDVKSATKEDLVKLPGVTPEAADRLVAAREKGPVSSHEQVQAALGLEPQAFEPIRPYLYVAPDSASRSR
jgi:hypothetical protein